MQNIKICIIQGSWFFFFGLFEKERKSSGKGRRKGEAGSPWSGSPTWSPGPQDHNWAEVRRLTDWATQVPLRKMILNIGRHIEDYHQPTVKCTRVHVRRNSKKKDPTSNITNYFSIFCLYGFAYSSYFIKMKSHNIYPFVPGTHQYVITFYGCI